MLRALSNPLGRMLMRRSFASAAAASSSSAASPAAQRLAAAPVFRPRRALLYMPGSSPKMLQKATTLNVDTV